MAKILAIDGKIVTDEGQVFTDAGGVECCCEPVVGACCLPDRSCVDGVTESECEQMDGVFQGADTMCADVDCTTPRACCLCSQVNPCVDTTPDMCKQAGGISQPLGVLCADDPCPAERACCYDNPFPPPARICSDLLPCECLELPGGEPQQEGQLCADVDCAMEGACCFPPNAQGDCPCTIVTAEQCMLDGGFFQGVGEECPAGPFCCACECCTPETCGADPDANMGVMYQVSLPSIVSDLASSSCCRCDIPGCSFTIPFCVANPCFSIVHNLNPGFCGEVPCPDNPNQETGEWRGVGISCLQGQACQGAIINYWTLTANYHLGSVTSSIRFAKLGGCCPEGTYLLHGFLGTCTVHCNWEVLYGCTQPCCLSNQLIAVVTRLGPCSL